MAACRFCLTCPEGYSLPRTPRKKFNPNYLLWAACNPGARETVVVLGISWHPVSPYAHGIGASRNLLPLIAPGTVYPGGLPIAHMLRNR